MLSYTIRLSVTIKEYKEVPLSKRLHSLLEACSPLQVHDVCKGAKVELNTVVTIGG